MMASHSAAFNDGRELGASCAAELIAASFGAPPNALALMYRGAFEKMENQLGVRAAAATCEADLQEFERGIVAGFVAKADEYKASAVNVTSASGREIRAA